RSAPQPDRWARRRGPLPETEVESLPAWSPVALLDELGQLRDDLMQVADDAEIREFEDGRVGILVDRDDHTRALHAHLVLDRARDATRDVELRSDGPSRLADLRRIGIPARIDDRARRTHGAAERLRELLHEGEVLRGSQTAAAGDDHVRVLDRRALALLV